MIKRLSTSTTVIGCRAYSNSCQITGVWLGGILIHSDGHRYTERISGGSTLPNQYKVILEALLHDHTTNGQLHDGTHDTGRNRFVWNAGHSGILSHADNNLKFTFSDLTCLWKRISIA